MKLTAKSIIPLFIALIFVGSIFVVFTRSGGGKTGSAELTINFGMPDMVENKEFRISGNMTALDLVSGYANHVTVEAGNINCIADYCNTNGLSWVLYVNNLPSEESAEKYVVKDNDNIMFRYEEVKQTQTNKTI